MCVLLLQQPYPKSRSKHHQECLQHHLPLWLDGDLPSLLTEARSIQDRLPRFVRSSRPFNLARSFSNLMFKGKVKDALHLLSDRSQGRVLQVSEKVPSSDGLSVLEVLKSKHPPSHQVSADTLIGLGSSPPSVHPVIFDSIDACCVRSAALRTFGAGGPSQTDAHSWRR